MKVYIRTIVKYLSVNYKYIIILLSLSSISANYQAESEFKVYVKEGGSNRTDVLWLYKNGKTVFSRFLSKNSIVHSYSSEGIVRKILGYYVFRLEGKYAHYFPKALISKDTNGNQLAVPHILSKDDISGSWIKYSSHLNLDQFFDSLQQVSVTDSNHIAATKQNHEYYYSDKQDLKSDIPVSFISYNKDSLSKIKAVVVVGSDMGGPDYDPKMKSEADKIVSFLNNCGFQTVYLIGDKATSYNVVEASDKAKLFLYMGHGYYDIYKKKPGGIYLSDGVFGPNEIYTDLHLANDAIVLMSHVCYSSGATAGDGKPVSLLDAQNRVCSFAEPFTKKGVLFYYSNNEMGSMYTFLKNMLDLNLLEAINKESLNPVDKLVFDKKIYQYLVISDSLNWKKNLRIVPGLKHQMEVGLFRE